MRTASTENPRALPPSSREILAHRFPELETNFTITSSLSGVCGVGLCRLGSDR